MNQLSIGCTVLFVIGEGVVRPAIVVNVNSATSCNLRVFTDGTNDTRHLPRSGESPQVVWRSSVFEDPSGKSVGSWHWPSWA